jgi:hypothetical protein
MATKTDFTAEEWGVLQWAVTDALTYTSLADASFWGSFSEAGAAAKFMAQQHESSSSQLVRELAGDIRAKADKELADNRVDIAGEASARIEQAAKLIADKSPDDSEAFKELIYGVADAAAEASKGISPAEQTALDRIKAALGE